MDRSSAASKQRRFHLLQGGGPQASREAEQLDRFLIAPDPLLIASLRREEQELRRRLRRRKLAWGLAVLLALAVVTPLWRSGFPRFPAGIAGAAAASPEPRPAPRKAHLLLARRLVSDPGSTGGNGEVRQSQDDPDQRESADAVPSCQPPALGSEQRAQRAADEIADHVERVETAPRVGDQAVDPRLIGDVAGLDAQVEQDDADDQPGERPRP